MAEGKQWQRLTAERKFRIFLETRNPDAPVGEILRRYGLTLEDLRAIEEAVESSAIAGLKVRAGHRNHATPGYPGGVRSDLPRTPGEGAGLGRAHRGVHPAQKKRALGLAERRGRAPLASEAREASLMAVREAQQSGLSQEQAARALGLSARTLQRWQCGPVPSQRRRGTPRPWNALLPEEQGLLCGGGGPAGVGRWLVSDAGVLAPGIRAGRAISHVAVWRYLQAHGASTARGRRRGEPVGAKPDIRFAQQPNSLWCWDITHLRTTQPWVFLYLYVLLDWVSRKVIAWHLAETLDPLEVLTLWDQGLQKEGLLELPTHVYPRSLS